VREAVHAERVPARDDRAHRFGVVEPVPALDEERRPDAVRIEQVEDARLAVRGRGPRQVPAPTSAASPMLSKVKQATAAGRAARSSTSRAAT
jgi:hypothetical protein